MNILLPDNFIGATMKPEDMTEFLEQVKEDIMLKDVTLPKKPSSDGYYHLNIKTEHGRTQIKDKTLEGLKRKYIDKYNSLAPTFDDVFEKMKLKKLSLVRDPDKYHSVQNTIARYDADYKRFFLGSNLRTKPISQITKRELEEFVEYNLTRYDLHRSGLMNLRTVLSKTFQHAKYEGYSENINALVDYSQFDSMLFPSEKISNRIHTKEEIANIIREVRRLEQGNPKFLARYALELQMLAGTRRGEIPPLRWTDVNGVLSITREQVIDRTTGEDIIVNHTKTDKDRVFPITDDIEDFLGRLREAHDKLGLDSEYLFPSSRTCSGVIRANQIHNCYYKICKKLNISLSHEARKGVHSFRRNHITQAVNNSNGNIVMAAELYGNSVQTIRRNYYDKMDVDKALDVANTIKLW